MRAFLAELRRPVSQKKHGIGRPASHPLCSPRRMNILIDLLFLVLLFTALGSAFTLAADLYADARGLRE